MLPSVATTGRTCPGFTRITALPKNRCRLARLLILTFFALYLVMIPLNSVIEEEHAEVFPFFSWSLFDDIPEWQTSEYALVIDAVDGQQIEEDHYLIPSSDIRDWKALRSSAVACAKNINCDDTVADVLYPIIWRYIGEHNVDFRIIRADIDLHDVRDSIDDLAEGTTTRTDFFQPRAVVGRWNTETGRMSPSTQAE